MSQPIKPTPLELYEFDDETIRQVHHESSDDWRHGCTIFDVFHRVADDTYWSACYRRSTDGETNELTEDDGKAAIIEQVWPHRVTVTEYKNTQPKEAP